jgi:hypothetical protein
MLLLFPDLVKQNSLLLYRLLWTSIPCFFLFKVHASHTILLFT